MAKDDQRIHHQEIVMETLESEAFESFDMDTRDTVPRAENPLTENPFLKLEKPASGENSSSRMQASNRKTEAKK